MKKNNFIKFIFFTLSFVILILLIILFSNNKKNSNEKEPKYITINNKEYSETEYVFYYTLATNNYLFQYKDFLDYLELDKDKPFSEQWLDKENNITWEDYFRELGYSLMQTSIMLYEDSLKNNYKMTNNSSYDDFISSFNAAAKAKNISYDEYIKELFSDTMTNEILEEQLKIYTVSLNYSEFLLEKYKNEINEKNILNYYKSNKDNYDTVYYNSFTVNYDKNVKNDDEKNGILTFETAENKAKNVLMANNSEEFNKLSYENAISTEKNLYYKNNATYSNANNKEELYESLRNWMYDPNRKHNDKTVINDEDNSKIHVILFDKRELNNNPTVNFRHILLSIEDYKEKKLLEKSANDMFNYLNSNSDNENIFIEFANKYSANKVLDGLQKNISKDELNDEVDDWLFDKDRKQGDQKMFYINSNYNILYFLNKDEPLWKVKIKNKLAKEKYDNYTNEKLNKYTLEFNNGEKFNLLDKN